MAVAVPDTVQAVGTETEEDRVWHVVIINDDRVLFAVVIMALMQVIGMSHAQAERCAQQVHREGRAVAMEGTRGECERVVSALLSLGVPSDVAQAGGPT